MTPCRFPWVIAAAVGLLLTSILLESTASFLVKAAGMWPREINVFWVFGLEKEKVMAWDQVSLLQDGG